MDEIRFETVPLCRYTKENPQQPSLIGRWNCACHGFHNPCHNRIARADALMSTRFICACSRMKPTTETKNSASKVIRVTINSSLRPKPGLFPAGGGKRPGGYLPRRFGAEGLAGVALRKESAHLRAGGGRRSQAWRD